MKMGQDKFMKVTAELKINRKLKGMSKGMLGGGDSRKKKLRETCGAKMKTSVRDLSHYNIL
jgi:hypothetical protein